MLQPVFLPGFSMQAQIWKNTFFNQDLPGQADGIAPQSIEDVLGRIVETWTTQGFSEIHLIGWSLGGMLAQELALRYPQRIKKLVLIASTAQFVSSDIWPWGVRPSALKILKKKIENHLDSGLESFLQTAALSSEKNLLPAIYPYLKNNLASAVFYLNYLSEFSSLKKLNQIEQPVLILAGLADRLCPYSAQNQLFENIPNSKLISLAEAGHFPFLSHPQTIEKQIQLFLN